MIHNLLPQTAPLWAPSYSPRWTEGRVWAESARVGRVIAWTPAAHLDDDEPTSLIPVVAADGAPRARIAAGEDVHELFDTRDLAMARSRELAPPPRRAPEPEPLSSRRLTVADFRATPAPQRTRRNGVQL